ncbi:hypothetical protein GQ600_680 [Phytophthora cactorum]|nr:hypothetical protein GQ600_680 [Phytophthora cactorum]
MGWPTSTPVIRKDRNGRSHAWSHHRRLERGSTSVERHHLHFVKWGYDVNPKSCKLRNLTFSVAPQLIQDLLVNGETMAAAPAPATHTPGSTSEATADREKEL